MSCDAPIKGLVASKLWVYTMTLFFLRQHRGHVLQNILISLGSARMAAKVADLALQDLPETLAECYLVSRAAAPTPAAYKIGGANNWSRKVFENTEVFFGPLLSEEVFLDTEELPVAGLVGPLAEPELMLELLDPEATDMLSRFSRIGWGFEIPASVLGDETKTTLHGQICDRAGAGALWVGAIDAFDPAVFAQEIITEFRLNNGETIAGSTSNVIGGPMGAANEMIALAKRYDMPLARGQWIATGGVNPAVPISPGDTVWFSAMGQQISVRFSRAHRFG